MKSKKATKKVAAPKSKKKTIFNDKELKDVINRIEAIGREELDGLVLVITDDPESSDEQRVTLKTCRLSGDALRAALLQVMLKI